MTATLTPEPLTREAFARYGEVIAAEGTDPVAINGGAAARHHALATVDVAGAPAVISVFVVSEPAATPARIDLLERHPSGTQAFVPLAETSWVVVVADAPAPDAVRAFAVGPGQGVQIGRGVWHAPLVCREAGSRFLVVDRARPEDNLEEARLPQPVFVAAGR